jgi:hypothetical protein
MKDLKRYLHVASIARDRLLVVKHNEPMTSATELIIIPRSVINGIVTALHIKLGHPTKHQLFNVMKRHFYALDMSQAVDRATKSCHLCASIQTIPDSLVKQTSEDAPESVGISFAADVLRRNTQFILLLRETATSFTTACIIDNEKHETLRDALLRLSSGLHPLDGPPAVIRVDPAPGFVALKDDDMLRELGICLEIGRVKNINKNPVAEKAIYELECELIRLEPGGGSVTPLLLSLALARLNSRIRTGGLSSRELWTQRDQFSHKQIPVSDRETILKQHERRFENHKFSEKSKHKSGSRTQSSNIHVGDLVYLYADKNKTNARSRYLVTSVSGEWCMVKKFSGNQLRATSYKVKQSECYKVPNTISDYHTPICFDNVDSDMEEPPIDSTNTNKSDFNHVNIPEILSRPADSHISINENVFLHNDLLDDTHENTVSFDPEYTQDKEVTEDAVYTADRPIRNRRPPKYLEDYVMN